MNEDVKSLHKLCDVLSEELEEYSRKIEKADKMSAGDLEAVDKLSHALKSIKTTIAMMEAEDDDGGYSNRYMPHYGYAYNDGRGMSRTDGYGGMSNAGRRNAKRDSMGRYSREGGYSYADSMDSLLDEMRGMMDSMPDEKRREVERFINKMDRM